MLKNRPGRTNATSLAFLAMALWYGFFLHFKKITCSRKAAKKDDASFLETRQHEKSACVCRFV